jgi:hypothetical protein
MEHLLLISCCALALCASREAYRSGAKYWTTLIVAPANISVLNDVFAQFIVPLIAIGRFSFIPPMYWTL